MRRQGEGLGKAIGDVGRSKGNRWQGDHWMEVLGN